MTRSDGRLRSSAICNDDFGEECILKQNLVTDRFVILLILTHWNSADGHSPHLSKPQKVRQTMTRFQGGLARVSLDLT